MNQAERASRAIRQGRVDLFKKCDFGHYNFKGIHAIFNNVAYYGNIEALEFMIKKFGSELVTYENSSCLQSAALNNQTKAFMFLVEQGADILAEQKWGTENPNYSSTTPLYWACTFKGYEIADYLIANGADVNHKSQENLRAAIDKQDFEMIRLLILAGIEIEDNYHYNVANRASREYIEKNLEAILEEKKVLDFKKLLQTELKAKAPAQQRMKI
ncbi:hypothetical protein C6Q09_19470 [Burkholderia multivorans]|uniref:ankyrin repeat domain-containing protein n=1 Tax=Burkholderia multivorans TaxID=87883 RepID=UPI000CFF2FF2|nr:ankyrin repeat domain-containing protein [Burkholderia multivorans]PRF67856.1 hypothetical protein C6Q09_19470 [Burkholderia multivorans]